MANLVGALEPWNFMTFHIIWGIIIIPTDQYFSEGWRKTTNQYDWYYNHYYYIIPLLMIIP
jgi:hypothetical protein